MGAGVIQGLSNIKDDPSLGGFLPDIYYAGAILKIMSEGVGRMNEFGDLTDNFKNYLKQFGTYIIEVAKDSSLNLSDENIVERVIAGIIAGSGVLTISGVDSNSELNPPRIATPSAAMEIYGDYLETNLSFESKSDFRVYFW